MFGEHLISSVSFLLKKFQEAGVRDLRRCVLFVTTTEFSATKSILISEWLAMSGFSVLRGELLLCLI